MAFWKTTWWSHRERKIWRCQEKIWGTRYSCMAKFTLFRGVSRRRVHRFSAEEVCTSSDVSRGARGRLAPWRRPYLHQGRPPRCRSPRQWPSGDLSSDRMEKGTSCTSGLGKLGRRDVLDDLQQATVVPWSFEALYWLFIRLCGRPVEVCGHLELRTTSTDGVVSRTENIRYLVVNAPSAYDILLGRPTLNRLRAVVSTRHMKIKFPNLGGKVITIKSDKKEAKRCYENSLKTKRGVFMVTTKWRRGHPCRDRPRKDRLAETTRTSRRSPEEEDWRQDVQAWKIARPSSTRPDCRGQSTTSECLRIVRLGHARHRLRLPVSPPHHGPQCQACPLEKKEVQRREATCHKRRGEEVAEHRPYKGDPVPWVVGKRGLGEEGQREVEDVCLLHGPQQSLPEGLIPSIKHRRLGGQCLGL